MPIHRCYAHPLVARVLGDIVRPYVGIRVWRETQGGRHSFATPTVNDVHVDGPLTMISIGYKNLEYIGPDVFPRVPVTNKSDLYFTYTMGDWFRQEASVRAPGTAARRVGYAVTTSSYLVKNQSIEKGVSDELRAAADNPLDPDREAAEITADHIDRRVEKDVATAINTSGNWTTNVTLVAATQWDNAASDPFTQFKTARLTVSSQIGRKANTVVMGVEPAESLFLHPDLLDRVKYTGSQESPAMVTPAMLAALFQVDRVLIGGALEDTATEGATSSISRIWAKHAWLGYVSERPALITPSAGYTFTTGRLVDRYDERATKSNVVRAEEAYDVKVTAAGAGYRFVDATS